MGAIKGDNVDFTKSNETKQKMNVLFEKAVADSNGYRLLYAYETVDKPLFRITQPKEYQEGVIAYIDQADEEEVFAEFFERFKQKNN